MTTRRWARMLAMYAGKERRNRFVALALAAVLLGTVVLGLLATLAAASAHAAPYAPSALPSHASLVSITPANGALLDRVPSRIELTFDDVVSPNLAQVLVTRDGAPVDVGTPKVDRSLVTAPIAGNPGPGSFHIVWRVVSDDGHPVSGESTFSVTGAAGGSRPKATPTYKTPQMQPTTFGHPDHLPGLIVAGLLLLGGVGLLAYEHQRRKSHEDQPIS